MTTSSQDLDSPTHRAVNQIGLDTRYTLGGGNSSADGDTPPSSPAVFRSQYARKTWSLDIPTLLHAFRTS